MTVITETHLIGMMVLVSAMVVFLTWFLVRSFRKGTSSKAVATKTALESPEEKEKTPEPPTIDQPESEGPTAFIPSQTPRIRQPQPVHQPEGVLLMQVWRDEEGYLVVEVEGQRFRRLFDIRDGDLGRSVLDTVNQLVAFTKGRESRVELVPPSREPLSTSLGGLDKPNGIVAGANQSFAVVDQFQPQPQTPTKLSRITMDPVPLRRRSAAKDMGITLNLAYEIDQLLQMRVRNGSEFSNRRIRVASARDGGLRFEVDGIRYGGLDEIPEANIQAVIRAAINDWEVKR
jgi:hypothetical protein